MTDFITGKVWHLDSVAGLVSANPVTINLIRVTWATASAGLLVLSTSSTAGGYDVILRAETVTSATLGWDQMTQDFPMGNQTFSGLRKVTCTGLAASAIQIVTGVGG